MWTDSMTFSPQLFWRAHHTIRFISGAYFLKSLVRQQRSQSSIKEWRFHERAICNAVLMRLYEPRLAEVRRLENFLDGCQNRVGWHFHFLWSLSFSLIAIIFIEKLDCRPHIIVFQGVVLSQFSKAVNSGDFCLAHLLTKRLETVWRNKSREKICQICQ